MSNLDLFREYVEIAEKNLSYKTDVADETALKYYRMALEIDPDDPRANIQYIILDKLVNHKNYTYPIDDQKTIELIKVFVDCCNVKEFDRLYNIISDDFVCISRYFGRTKKEFIESIYSERKSMFGMFTEVFQYENKSRKIPCVFLNSYGVLFFNIENNLILRAFEYKIDEKIDRKKLTKLNE